jgi:hypothetical protein
MRYAIKTTLNCAKLLDALSPERHTAPYTKKLLAGNSRRDGAYTLILIATRIFPSARTFNDQMEHFIPSVSHVIVPIIAYI